MLVEVLGEPLFALTGYSQGFVEFAALPVFATNCTAEPEAEICLAASRIGVPQRKAANR